MRRLSELVGRSRRAEAEIVAHIAEVDARRLYAREAVPSMFAYCTEVLRLSEAQAYLRIRAARASLRHPMILTMLGDGRLHLSGIAELAPHLTPANRDGLLAGAVHRSKRQVLELIAGLAPRPDVPDRIARLRESKVRPGNELAGDADAAGGASQVEAPLTPPPAPLDPLVREDARSPLPRGATLDGTLGALQLRPDAVAGRSSPALSTAPVPATSPAPQTPPSLALLPAASPATVEPLAPGRYKVQFTASRELWSKLERLRALMPHGARSDLASLIDAAVTEKLARLEARRFGRTDHPRGRSTATRAGTAAGDSVDTSMQVSSTIARHVPAAVRRAVHDRDGNRCTYRDASGRRRPARDRLEFHHLHPFAMGGEHSVANVRLVCRAHNVYLAEADYGRAAMSRHRRDLSPMLVSSHDG